MPVASTNRRERPSPPVPGEAAVHMGVPDQVFVIVVAQECVVPDLPIGKKDEDREAEADGQVHVT